MCSMVALEIYLDFLGLNFTKNIIFHLILMIFYLLIIIFSKQISPKEWFLKENEVLLFTIGQGQLIQVINRWRNLLEV